MAVEEASSCDHLLKFLKSQKVFSPILLTKISQLNQYVLRITME